MAITDYDRCDGLDLAALVKTKQASPTELLDEAISRTERVNPQVNAVVTKCYEEARQVAAAPLPEGPFQGVPFLLKDLQAAQKDTPLSFGCRFFEGFAPDADNTLVTRYRQA